MMQRRFERDDFYRVIFGTDNNDKKINYENDEKSGQICIVKGKSGITDKPCSHAQEDRSIVITKAALTDNNVKFKTKKSKDYYITWEITQDEILNNALTYLKSKGIAIKCTYKNTYDSRLLKKLIAKILCEYVIPAIHYPNENQKIEDNDDISESFAKMVSDIKILLSNSDIRDRIYDFAKADEILKVEDNFSIDPKEHRITTINNTSYFVIPFNCDYRTPLKIIKDRFKEETGVDFEPFVDIDNDPSQMFLPKYFLYVSDDMISKESSSEYASLILMKASRLLRNQIKKEIHDYYVYILDHIAEYSDRILSIDYVSLYNGSIDSGEKLKEEFNDFKINNQELWEYMKASRISPRGSIEFILELLKQSVSIFCQQIYLLCENMIVLPFSEKDNKAYDSNANTTSKNTSLDNIPEGEYYDECYENMADDFENRNNDEISNDQNTNTEAYGSINQDDNSEEIENNNSSEIDIDYSLFTKLHDRTAEISEHIMLLICNGMRPKVNKFYDEIKKYIEMKDILTYCDKIKTIIKSKRLSQMIDICNNNKRKTNPLVAKMIHYNPLINTSPMYRTSLNECNQDDYFTDSSNDLVFNYNMYEDLKCALSKLYDHLHEIN